MKQLEIKKTLLLSILLLFSFSSYSQYSRNLSGYVSDYRTGEALIGVKISLLRWGSVTYTNQFGYFNLSVPVGDIQLEFDYSNYKQVVYDLNLKKDSNVLVALKEHVGGFGTNNFRRKSLNDIESPIVGKTDLPIELIESFPYFLAESDLIKGLQMIPGVNAGNEGFSNLYVRGGSADQNLLLLDGVPVYNNNHFFGLFSVYNSEAVNDVQIYKGGMPSKFGGRLSSVIDITMDEGNTNEMSGNLTTGLMSARLLLSGPIGSQDKTTYNFSLRRTILDRLFDPNRDDNSETITNFYDLNGKLKHRIDKKNQLFASIYTGRDKYELSDISTDSATNQNFRTGFLLKWGNLTGNLRWNHIFNSKIFLNLSVAYTQYQSNLTYTNEQVGTSRNPQFTSRERTNGIRDFIINSDWEYNLTNRHKVNFGSSFIRHNFNTGKEKSENKNINNTSNGIAEIGNINGTKTYELALFAEDNFRINKYHFLQWGLRLNNYITKGNYVPLVSPRINYRLILNKKLAFKSAYNRTYQVTNLMTNRGTGGLATNFWSPSIDEIKPQSAHQFSLGFANKINENLQLNIDGYYKIMQNVIEVTNPNFFDVSEDWKNFVKQGSGNAYGMEMMIQKNQGWVTGWFGYTLSYTNREYETLNSGNSFPFSFDQRHMFKVYTNWKLDDYLTLLGALTAGSSPRFTMPTNKYYDLNGNLVLDYGEVNNFQPNPYIRFDVGWIRTTYGVGVSQEMKITFYNVLATKNPMSVFAEQDDVQQQAFKAMKYNNPRFVPGITYKMIF